MPVAASARATASRRGEDSRRADHPIASGAAPETWQYVLVKVRLALLSVLAILPILFAAPSAAACSCSGEAALTNLTGVVREERTVTEGLGGHDYDLVVDGQDVERVVTVRIATINEDGTGGSSCANSERLLRGGRYDVAAYTGSRPDGSSLLFVNSCGGGVTLIGSPVEETTASPAPKSEEETRSVLLPAFAGALCLSLSALLFWRWKKA